MSTSRCACQRWHRPQATVVQVHHVVPQSWVKAGATPAKPETVPLCGTAHDLVHDLLNRWVRAGGPILGAAPRGYPRYVVELAKTAWEHRPPSGKRPPYTVAHPQHEKEPPL